MVTKSILIVPLILLLVFAPAMTLEHKCLKNDEGNHPIFDITDHIQAISNFNSSEAIDSLSKVMKEVVSPTLYYSADYHHNILQILGDTFIQVIEWIAEADSRNSIKLTRKFILALRTVDVTNSTKPDDAENQFVSTEDLKTINKSLAAIVIDRDFPLVNRLNILDQAQVDFVSEEIRNGLASLPDLLPVPFGSGILAYDRTDLTRLREPEARLAEFSVVTMNLMAFPDSYQNLKDFIKGYMSKRFMWAYSAGDGVGGGVLSGVNLRILLNVNNGSDNETFELYQRLLQELVTRWQTENKCNVILNLQYYNNSTRSEFEDGRIASWKSVSRTTIPYLFLEDYDAQDNAHVHVPCLNSRLGQIASKFDALMLDLDAWRTIISQEEESPLLNSYYAVCREEDLRYSNLPVPPNIILFATQRKCFGINECEDSVEQVLNQLANNTVARGMTVESVVFAFSEDYEGTSFTISNYTSVHSLGGLRLGCLTNLGNLASPPEEWLPKISTITCPLVPEVKGGTISMWEFNLQFNFDMKEDYRFLIYTHMIQRGLNKLFEKVVDLRRHNPRREVMIKLVTRREDPAWRNEHNLFCDKSTLGFHSILDGVATWARIHQVKVILKPAFGTAKDVGWWSVLANVGGQFVARNYPSDSSFGKGDPCIPWKEGTTEQISFRGEGEQISGLSLNMGIRKHSRVQPNLNVEELKTMTLFGLHVSPTLEIVTRTGNVMETLDDLRTIREMILDSNFTKILTLNNIFNGTLFINIPAAYLPSAVKSVQKLLIAFQKEEILKYGLKLGGIHITISAKTEPKFSQMIVSEIRQVAKFGVVFWKCEHNCDYPYSTIESWPAVEYVRNASYFVGEYTPRDPPYDWETSNPVNEKRIIQELLDSQLKDKRDLVSIFPNLQSVVFRQTLYRDMEVIDSKNVMDARYIRHLVHLNAFRKSYNISNFVPGFGHEIELKALNTYMEFEMGWWNISNYSDLSDRSVFSEMQSNHLQKPSWRPTYPEDTGETLANNVTFSWTTILIVSSVMIAAVLGMVFAVIYIFRLKKKLNFLTEKEVREFYEGALLENSNQEQNEYLQQKFSRSFEVPKSELVSDERRILGTGNFGIVYEAMVKGVRVAVKVPHDNCSKATFRSMLFEVKILSYLGTHVNVIELVGCYTKEIVSGVIFIATKLCERGSVQNHLIRELRSEDASTEDSRMGELIRFSFEIASGMEYIRKKNVVHGDLSTRNVLLDAELTCKIADFGLSRKVYEYGKYVKENQEPLPWRWMAYESLADMEFTSKSDVWSYGVTLWEIFSLGMTPYPGLAWTVDFADDLKNGLRLNSPEYATDDVYFKMRSCWNLDTETRPGFDELMEFFIRIRNQLFYTEL